MLPSFSSPPLDEVVVGVQFNSPSQYNTLHLNEIYDLFKSEYPRFDEQPRVEPQFETFGGHSQPGIHMQFGPAPLRNRSFFIANDENHLIQFQDDRLLLNWRQGNNGALYPRYDAVIEKFSKSLSTLSSYYEKRFGDGLFIKQAEMSYINIIKVSDFNMASHYLKFLNFENIGLEGFGLNASEVITRSSKSVARLHIEANSVWSVDARQKAVRLCLTCRGKPELEGVKSSLEFLNLAHEIIVKRFCDLTTSNAQQEWEIY